MNHTGRIARKARVLQVLQMLPQKRNLIGNTGRIGSSIFEIERNQIVGRKGSVPGDAACDRLFLKKQIDVFSQNGTRHLYAGYRDGWVYVATESSNTTPATNDHFIFIADEMPASQTGQPWAKAGTVGAFDAYLAREQSNNFVGWFNIQGSTVPDPQTNNAQYLEGSFNLAEQLPGATTTLWIAHGDWGNNNGDPLSPATQVPATLDGNGNIEAAEYFELVLSTVEVTTFDDYDFNQDCAIDAIDFETFDLCLGGPGAPIPGACAFESVVDADADNDVDLADFAAFMEVANSCP